MKTLVSTVVAALFLSFNAQADAGAGTFVYEHDVAFGGGYTRASCVKEHGRWTDGACFFQAADTVEISKAETDFQVKVNTIRTNGRDCEFTGAAKSISETELLASTESELWLPSEDGKDIEVVPALCELKITYLDADTLKVEKLDAQKCASVCGTSLLGLDVPRAVRTSN